MISSSWRNASSLSNNRSSSSGASVELSSCGSWTERTTSAAAAAFSMLSRRRMTVSLASLSRGPWVPARGHVRCRPLCTGDVRRLVVCHGLAHCCQRGSLGVNCCPHIVHEAHLRSLDWDAAWVLTAHLRQEHVDIVGAAEGVSQLSCVGDVRHLAFPCKLVLSHSPVGASRHSPLRRC